MLWFLEIYCLSFQDIKIAAMNCIEGLYALWLHADFSSKRNGIVAVVISLLFVLTIYFCPSLDVFSIC